MCAKMENATTVIRLASFRSLAVRCFCVAFALLFISVLPLSNVSPHPPPAGTSEPTEQEKTNWNNKIQRLEQNATSMPISIGEALLSLTGDGGYSFECPEGCSVEAVTVSVTTALVHWDTALAADGSAGTYKWNYVWSIEEGLKTITCQNWVMLDPAVATAEENNPPLGTLADEALAYHELLHCQLLINAMLTSAWQTKACNCEFDDEPSDGDHSEIYPAVDSFMTNRAPGVNVRVVRPPAQASDGDGKFDIELGATDKDNWTFEILEPAGGSNVLIDSVTVTKVDGKFHVKGKLVDKTKKGKFFIRIDPPDEWVFGGIENCLVVLPAADIPTLTEWGLVIFGIVLLGFITWVFLRRRKAVSVGA